MSYLVEGRYDSQEVHWEVLQNQVSFRRLRVFSWSFTDVGNILHVLEGRSLEVVVKPCRQKLLLSPPQQLSQSQEMPLRSLTDDSTS